jgi:NADH-quinone oxidoreductase subunit J
MPVITLQLVIFISVAALAIASALGMLFSRNTVYSALLLVFNFTTVAFLYFMMGAPFIGLAQITVYAGAIMVLFLFVIMLLGTEQIARIEQLSAQSVAAVLLGLVIITEAVVVFLLRNPTSLVVTSGGDVVSVNEIGGLLYSQYLLPFEITSFILLVAVVGAIILTKQEKPTGKAVEGEVKK